MAVASPPRLGADLPNEPEATGDLARMRRIEEWHLLVHSVRRDSSLVAREIDFHTERRRSQGVSGSELTQDESSETVTPRARSASRERTGLLNRGERAHTAS